MLAMEEKKNYFLITMNFCSGDEYEPFYILAHCSDMKVIDQISDYFNYDFETDNCYLTPYGNAYKFAGYQTISEEDFNVLSKYLDVIGGRYE